MEKTKRDISNWAVTFAGSPGVFRILWFSRKYSNFAALALTFLVVGIYFLLLCSSPAGQFGRGEEEGQQSREEAVVGHCQDKSHQESKTRYKLKLFPTGIHQTGPKQESL